MIDLRYVKKLVEMLDESSVDSIEISSDKGMKIRISKTPQQRGAVLAKSSACQECVVRQYFRFQAGRSETAADRPLIRFVTDEFRNSSFRFKELILSLVLDREFPQEKQRLDVANNHQSR